MKPQAADSVVDPAIGRVSLQEAAARLNLCERRVIQLCRSGTLRADHAAVPGRSSHRLRWFVELASVEQLVHLRAARLPAKRPDRSRSLPDSADRANTLSIHEAAARLGIRTDTIYRCLRRGALQSTRVDLPASKRTKGLIRVSAESVERFLARRSAPRPPPQPRPPRPKKLRPILPDPWAGSDTVSVKEAAALLSRPVSSVYNLCNAGKLEKRLFPAAGRAKGMAVRVPLREMAANIIPMLD